MSYRLQPDEPLAPGIKRIAKEQVDDAVDYLTNPDFQPNEAIHEARKCFKKVRAVMRLVRDEIGEDVYERENVCYRDAGRVLSDVRDSAVKVETLDNLKETYADQLTEDSFAEARETLLIFHRSLRQRVLDEGKMAEVAQTIQSARERLDELPIARDDFAAISDGLHRVYKRGRKRLADAYHNPRPEAFHEWRKRVKYLWYHTRILRPLWKEPLAVLADEIHDLSDYLGDDHDLAELRHIIEQRPSLFPDDEARHMALALIDRERERLETAGRPLGQRIYAEKPKRFVKRIGAYWQVRQKTQLTD